MMLKKHAPSFFRRFSVTEQIFLARGLSFLLTAGVSVPQGLRIIAEQESKSRSRTVYRSLLAEIENGQSLAHALRAHLPGFSSIGFALVRMGEVSGTLAASLSFLADELEKKQLLRRKVMSALAYPFIIAIATLGITVFLILYIFPKIAPIFISLRVDLPITTRILIALADFLSRFGLIASITAMLIGSAIFAMRRRSQKLRAASDRLLLALPIFGPLARRYALANVCRMIGILLASDMPLVPALTMVGEAQQNVRYRQALEAAARAVRGGGALAASLKKRGALFPDLLVQLVAVGEQTGNLPAMLHRLSQFYESEVDARAKNLSTALEPLLMLAMGLAVGFVAISIITPMYGITGHLSMK